MSTLPSSWPARPLVLGTRGSALALAQVELTRAALGQAYPELAVEVQEFITRGDQKLDLSLIRGNEAGGKGLFTKELEDALLDGRIDVAVHSLKDLPGHLPAGMEVVAVLPRAATGDVLISKHPGGLAGLPTNPVVGTSSVRRARQLTWRRPDAVAREWRGNVQTRLRKLAAAPEVAGIILAQAGLERLGFDLSRGTLTFEESTYHVHSLAVDFFPAIGQGAIALECCANRPEVRALLQGINHEPTRLMIAAERALQAHLEGDCTLPVGVRTSLAGEQLQMSAILFQGEESNPREAEGSGATPEEVARQVFAGLGL